MSLAAVVTARSRHIVRRPAIWLVVSSATIAVALSVAIAVAVTIAIAVAGIVVAVIIIDVDDARDVPPPRSG